MKNIIILSVFISICAKGNEIKNCDDCEKIIGEPIEQVVSEASEEACEYCTEIMESALARAKHYFDFSPSAKPEKVSIPDCEVCDLWMLSPPQLYDRACIAEVDGCHVQIAPITLKTSKLRCECELDTDKGKMKGGIHGILENPKLSLITKSCTEEMGDTFLHEEGHIGADKLHITCDGDEDFIKACEEEEHNYNVDTVVKAVANTLANTFINKNKEISEKIDCRF